MHLKKKKAATSCTNTLRLLLYNTGWHFKMFLTKWCCWYTEQATNWWEMVPLQRISLPWWKISLVLHHLLLHLLIFCYVSWLKPVQGRSGTCMEQCFISVLPLIRWDWYSWNNFLRELISQIIDLFPLLFVSGMQLNSLWVQRWKLLVCVWDLFTVEVGFFLLLKWILLVWGFMWMGTKSRTKGWVITSWEWHWV